MNGYAIGCFQRNGHETHIVVLDPSGHTYSYIQPNGTRTRHLTPTALSSHRPFVLDTLNFRNRFSLRAPYVCLKLMDSTAVRHQRRIRAPRATWPCIGDKTKVSRLYNDQDKCFEIQSIDGAAKVRLHLSGKLVDIFFVVEVKVSDDDMDETSSHAYYTTLRQSFTVNETPENFKVPVEILLAAKAAWIKDQTADLEYNGKNRAVSHLPRNAAFTARPAFSVIATQNDDDQPNECQSDFLSLAEILRVATLPSTFMYQRVVAEVVGNDATVFVSRRATNQLPEIVAQLNCNGFLLTAHDGFFTIYDELGRPQHRFTRETIPPIKTISLKGPSDLIESLCRHIDYVIQAFKYAAQMQHQSTLPSIYTQSNELELVEEIENEHGRFRAFCGGRIRVAFADRTILQIESDGENCSFFFPDGTSGQIMVASAPLRHRPYIYQALEFGHWAFASQKERMQRHEKRQETQAIVTQELQRISVRCGMNSEVGVLQQTRSDKTKEKQSLDASNSSLALSQGAVQHLQAATQAHIASVNSALQAALMGARKTQKAAK